MMIPLHNNETVEDIQLKGYRLIQSKTGYRFGEDSVLLANYAADFLRKRRRNLRIFDLGCNSGILSFILAGKTEDSRITGVDILDEAIDMYSRNIKLNDLEHRMEGICCNWKEIQNHVSGNSADIVISNPPYYLSGSGKDPQNKERRTARHNDNDGVHDLVKATAYLLKSGGISLYIYPCARLTDVLTIMRENDMEPFRIRFIHSFSHSAPRSFILTARKNGRHGGLVIEKPLIVFKEKGIYSDEINIMYGKEPALTEDELYREIISK